MELRPIRTDELDTYVRACSLGFGESTSDEALARWRPATEIGRTRAVFDGDRIVATSGAFTFRLATCGGGAVAASGITAVTVRSTHRRRGLLRDMMSALLDDAVARGEPVAVLTASEGAIYGRFGFGVATDVCTIRLDRRVARLRPFDDAGTIERVDGKELGEVVRDVWDRHWRTRPGAVELTPGWFETRLADLPAEREGSSELLCAVHRDADGTADGYVLHRLKPSSTSGIDDGTVQADHVVANSPTAHLALWRYLLSIDLMATIETSPCSADDPVRWALTDPRHTRIASVRDGLWVRPLDVAAMLSSRAYRVADDLVLDVVDGTRADVGGRFRLATTAGGSATCERTDRAADVTLGVAELGSLWLGGVAPTTLAGAGRLAGIDRATLRRLDLLFSWDEAPFLGTGF